MDRKTTEHQSNTNNSASSSSHRETSAAEGMNSNPSIKESNENKGENKSSGIKTSTPARNENSVLFNVSNISSISTNRPSSIFQHPLPGPSGNNSRKVRCSTNAQLMKSSSATSSTQKKLAQKQSKVNLSDEDAALVNYNVMLQTVILNKMIENNNKNKEDELDKGLASLKTEIMEKQAVLNKTKEQIRKIKALSEQQALINQHKKDIKDAAGCVNKFNASHNPALRVAVTKELKRMRNKVEIENIAIPSNLQLHETLKNTLSSYEKLDEEPLVKVNETKELKDSLTQFSDCQQKIDGVYKSCCNSMPAVGSLVLKTGSDKVNEEKN